ncbi:penicillin-binding protein, putative [Talaromyces stipitatus ATCC 10500]|uniref:Penicillin-binding protein, putative n=1 Tax=Talaromyces stipitatus (strain ATCC 10500 / CBS 375.48 / QM 6759 / NRRL 1006) TaxID=441959 RepID=B8LTF9_TALSN|nr:penicillin-binding protein, putative [Talaromyces stipitatus ATCC 10500]EED23037.1 penicillin-binding protein, putative [Talaromyces stipitatus ATCC 10500]
MAPTGNATAAIPASEETPSANNGTPSTKTSPLNEEFEKLVYETLSKWHIQGVSIAVVDGDETWAEGYGIAALPDVPVRPSTLFYTGSTTKSFTAAAASLLVDDDEKYPNIKWTTPLNQIIRDDFVLSDEYATSHVTLEDALSNRSGLPGHELTLGRPGSVRDVVRSLRHFKMNKDVRTTWQYCNALFITVAHVIEVVTGEWLGDFLRKHIWDPLDMKSTFFSLEDAQKYVASSENDANLAIPYGWDEESSQAKEIPYCDAVLSGAGAVISNVLDYAKYIRSMMRQSGPLSKAGYAAMLTPRSFCPQMLPQLKKQMLYTLGWMSSTYHGEFVMLHPGGLEGMTATMVYFPERDWGALVFCNADGPGRETLAWYLIDEMLTVPQSQRINLYNVTQKRLAQRREYNSTAQQRLYPSIPSPARPLSLPLTNYTGTYTHPAHPDLIISVTSDDDPQLNVLLTGSFPTRMKLKHVTAEFFLAEIFLFRFHQESDAVVKAEFQINAEGRVTRFGAAIDFADMPDTLIWFERTN